MGSFEQLAIFWAGVLVAACFANRTRLTPVLYFLAVGAIFVNTGIPPVEPSELVRGFAETSIVLIMFAIGFEERVDYFVNSIRQSWGIALFGALASFCATYAVTWYYWQDFHFYGRLSGHDRYGSFANHGGDGYSLCAKQHFD